MRYNFGLFSKKSCFKVYLQIVLLGCNDCKECEWNYTRSFCILYSKSSPTYVKHLPLLLLTSLVASKALYIEAELKAGFDYNDRDQLIAFLGIHFKLRLFGVECEFSVEWSTNLDEFIDKIVKVWNFLETKISED